VLSRVPAPHYIAAGLILRAEFAAVRFVFMLRQWRGQAPTRAAVVTRRAVSRGVPARAPADAH